MSNEVVIKVENLSKQYRLGEVGTGTISHDLNRWWYRIRGKEDPYLHVGEVNDRNKKGLSEYVWALRDINFEVEQGEVLGVIGKNGAGKSTLLKVLSKVTAPTIGAIKAKGRIASLLEVGTGFHPELTGRENIFLNGAILGMTKREVTKKLDEIVDFANVERYIDTPVKRYSSGMLVRLGFAVAAHLDPEILIIDEVLAVGDAEFQKKCLGKMKSVSINEGRTILFVSHSMPSIELLCKKIILFEKGTVSFNGEVKSGIKRYLSLNNESTMIDLSKRKDRVGSQNLKFIKTWIEDENGLKISSISSGELITLFAELQLHPSISSLKGTLTVAFALYDQMGYQITDLSNVISEVQYPMTISKYVIASCTIPKLPLAEGEYRYNLFCTLDNETFDGIEYAGLFTVEAGDFFGTGKSPFHGQGGVLFMQKWQFKCVE